MREHQIVPGGESEEQARRVALAGARSNLVLFLQEKLKQLGVTYRWRRDDDGEVSSVSLNWMDKDEDDKDTLLRLTRRRDDDNASAPSSKKQKTFP